MGASRHSNNTYNPQQRDNSKSPDFAFATIVKSMVFTSSKSVASRSGMVHVPDQYRPNDPQIRLF